MGNEASLPVFSLLNELHFLVEAKEEDHAHDVLQQIRHAITTDVVNELVLFRDKQVKDHGMGCSERACQRWSAGLCSKTP